MDQASVEWMSWRAAAERALYGAPARPGPGAGGGPVPFYLRSEGPAGHFRTSVHVSPRYAEAVAELLLRVDTALGHPARVDVVEVGAGRGELAAGLLRAVDGRGGLTGRLRVRAVELAARPGGLDQRIEWCHGLPEPGTVTGLLFANEWLDNVPVDVVEADRHGAVRLVEVAPDGMERLGPEVGGADARWLERWWPSVTPGAAPEAGTRAEIGAPRDEAWAAAVRSLRRGLAVAVDYAHTAGARPPFGTLTGFRSGRQVAPVPDGSCDITAHVALDACAAAGEAAGAGATLLTSQRAALHALGVSGRRPPLALASTDPAGYVRALAAAGEAAELTDPGGLGSFRWLLQGVGVEVPQHSGEPTQEL